LGAETKGPSHVEAETAFTWKFAKVYFLTAFKTVFKAAVQAATIYALECIVHILLHGLEHAAGEHFPPRVYDIISWVGVISMVLCAGKLALVHWNETFAEFVEEMKEPWSKGDKHEE